MCKQHKAAKALKSQVGRQVQVHREQAIELSTGSSRQRITPPSSSAEPMQSRPAAVQRTDANLDLNAPAPDHRESNASLYEAGPARANVAEQSQDNLAIEIGGRSSVVSDVSGVSAVYAPANPTPDEGV